MNIFEQIKAELEIFAPEDREKFEKEFSSDIEIIRLERQAKEYDKNLMIVQAVKIRQRIQKIKLRVLQGYKADMKYRIEKVNLLKMKIPAEKLNTIIDNIIAMHMACDMLESYANEIEFILNDLRRIVVLNHFIILKR